MPTDKNFLKFSKLPSNYFGETLKINFALTWLAVCFLFSQDRWVRIVKQPLRKLDIMKNKLVIIILQQKASFNPSWLLNTLLLLFVLGCLSSIVAIAFVKQN